MTKQLSDKDAKLLELGKKLQSFYDMGYVSPKEALTFSFLKGLVGGIGAFIGGTLVITLILWVLTLFGQVPFVGQLIRALQHSLQK